MWMEKTSLNSRKFAFLAPMNGGHIGQLPPWGVSLWATRPPWGRRQGWAWALPQTGKNSEQKISTQHLGLHSSKAVLLHLQVIRAQRSIQLMEFPRMLSIAPSSMAYLKQLVIHSSI